MKSNLQNTQTSIEENVMVKINPYNDVVTLPWGGGGSFSFKLIKQGDRPSAL